MIFGTQFYYVDNWQGITSEVVLGGEMHKTGLILSLILRQVWWGSLLDFFTSGWAWCVMSGDQEPFKAKTSTRSGSGIKSIFNSTVREWSMKICSATEPVSAGQNIDFCSSLFWPHWTGCYKMAFLAKIKTVQQRNTSPAEPAGPDQAAYIWFCWIGKPPLFSNSPTNASGVSSTTSGGRVLLSRWIEEGNCSTSVHHTFLPLLRV